MASASPYLDRPHFKFTGHRAVLEMIATLATGQDFLSNLRNLTIYDWCPCIDSFEL